VCRGARAVTYGLPLNTPETPLPNSVSKKNTRALDGVWAALTETERVIENTRRDALSLFHSRGVIDRAALAKWVSGARDACWHVTDIVEHDASFVISIALPGVDPEFVELTRGPRHLVIRTRSGTQAGAAHVLQRLDLPVDLSSERVQAELRQGALVITAPKFLD
jgi:HSP20 family molecular chaperone IbpA